jgi:hypothetical protein
LPAHCATRLVGRSPRTPQRSAPELAGRPEIASTNRLLSRLRSCQISQNPIYRAEAESAVSATMKSLDPSLYRGQANFSLCHGLGGNAELLIYAAQVLNRPDWHSAAQQLGLKGIEMYEKNRMPWPVAFSEAANPQTCCLACQGSVTSIFDCMTRSTFLLFLFCFRRLM